MKFINKSVTVVLFLCATCLGAGEPTVYNESLIRGDWLPLHYDIARKNFPVAQMVIRFHPDQIQETANVAFDWEESMAISKIIVYDVVFDMNFVSPIDTQKITWGYSPLELAILYDAPFELINSLVKGGADVNRMRWTVEHKVGFHNGVLLYIEVRTPLFAAIKKQRMDVVELLINSGADVEHVLWNGNVEHLQGDFADNYWNIYNSVWKNFNVVSENVENNMPNAINQAVK